MFKDKLHFVSEVWNENMYNGRSERDVWAFDGITQPLMVADVSGVDKSSEPVRASLRTLHLPLLPLASCVASRLCAIPHSNQPRAAHDRFAGGFDRFQRQALLYRTGGNARTERARAVVF